VSGPIAAALLEQQAGVLHQHMVQMEREHRAHSQLQQQMQQQMQQQLQYQQMQMQDVMNGLLAQIRGIQALGGALALAAQPAAAPPAAALPAAAAGAAAAPLAPAPQQQQLAGAAAGRRPPLYEPY